METKHTPTPWSAGQNSEMVIAAHVTESERLDEIICQCGGHPIDPAFFTDIPGRTQANRDLIVRAVNNHKALLDACRSLVVVVMGLDRYVRTGNAANQQREAELAVALARAAIARAAGGGE